MSKVQPDPAYWADVWRDEKSRGLRGRDADILSGRDFAPQPNPAVAVLIDKMICNRLVSDEEARVLVTATRRFRKAALRLSMNAATPSPAS